MHGGIDIPGVELLDELGRGAHGAVYRGRRGSDYYAVKVALAPSDPSAFVRFQREAIALARAKHPGLPRVLDVAKSGAPYLVMELVEGETLAARLTRGTLSEEETRALGLQLADVLAHIHRLGLVHRDVKPRNIIFDEKSGRARIVDFGIAIGTASNNFAAAEGTVPYAAPEQLRGLSVDGRADLYSLGCVLYECLCGMPPLGPLSLARLGKADPVSDEAKLERAGISAEFARAIVKLTSQDARSRFAEAGELADALGATSPFDHVARQQRRTLPIALVGRERELAVLRRAWFEVEAGSPRSLAVEGPMGSGKTALLQVFCDQVRTEGHAAIYVACASYDPVPFSVARRLFEALLARVGEQKFTEAASGFESLLAVIAPALRRIFPSAPLVPDSDDAHHVILESAAKSLWRLLELEAKVVVCIDDCQWLDAGSSAILRKLLGMGGSSFLLLGQRSDVQPAPESDALRGVGNESIAGVMLPPLGEQAIEALITSYLGSNQVPAEVISRVAALSAPTPLGALEGVRTLLEERAILPDWSGWRLQPEVAEGVRLPESVVETLRARISTLEPIVPQVLLGAAVVGIDFEMSALPEITGCSPEEVSGAMREAYRASLVTGGAETFRFVHQAVREALLASCTEGKLRDLSGRAAEALDRKLLAEPESQRSELVYRVADLYWRAEWRDTPERAIAVIEEAAQRAFEAYDNRQVLHFLERAAEIRHATNRQPGVQTLYVNGEVLIRLGSLAAGRASLERALELSTDPLQRATILSRIAWVCEWELDSVRSLKTLKQAFAEVGAEFPVTSAPSLARSGSAWLRHAFRRVKTIASEDVAARERQKILCALYYRTFRHGTLSANIPQTIQAALLGLEAAQALGVSAALSRAYIAYGFVLTALGQGEKGRQYLKQGEDVATATRNPVAVAHAMQSHSVIAAWDGRLAEGLEAGARCLLEHGHWQDFSEHCHLAYNLCILESVRGRGYEELVWLEHVLRQVDLNKEAFGLWEYVELGARALLVHLGRAHEADRILRRLREVTTKIPKGSTYEALSFGPRVRVFTDVGDLGPGFEAIEAEFRLGRHDPRRVHLALAEYYLHVAHARVHACLRASGPHRSRRLEQLRAAADELRLAARIPVLRAHSLVVDGYVAHFAGNAEKAGKLFADADALAIEEESPWVRYAVARGRAHRLKSRSHIEVVLGEARRAEQIARENGAVHRLRWIREEFELPQTSTVFAVPTPSHASDVSRSVRPTSSATSRQLRRSKLRSGLRRLQERSQDADAARQLLLDELFSAIRAEQIHFFTLRNGRAIWLYGRDSAGGSVSAPAVDSFVREAVSGRLSVLVDDTETLRSRLAVPLIERGDVRMVVYAEAAGCGVFDAEDCHLIAEASSSLSAIQSTAPRPGDRQQFERKLDGERSVSALTSALAEHIEALAVDGSANDGALLARVTTLSRLLREAKRLERHEPVLVNINDVVTKTIQRIRNLLGADLELLTGLESTLHPVLIDPEHLELTLLHAVLGAHRWLQGKGVFIVETANVTIQGALVQELRVHHPGAHVMVTLSAVAEDSSGSAVGAPVRFGGLAEQMCRELAYANGGVLALTDDSPTGANLQVFFPRANPSMEDPGKQAPFGGSETLLIVDRNSHFRQELAGELKKLGYRVLLAEDLQGATTITEIHGSCVDVGVIELDPELDPRHRPGGHRGPPPVLLYTSQFPWNALRARGVGIPRAHFVQKPFSSHVLAERIRALLSDTEVTNRRKLVVS